jgi:hypothetical protein
MPSTNVLGLVFAIVLRERMGGDGGVLLPAKFAADHVAGVEALRRRGDHFAQTPAGHDVTGIELRAIGRALHPGPACRIEGKQHRTHQHFPGLRLGHLGFAKIEVVRAYFCDRLARINPLLVAGHVLLPPDLSTHQKIDSSVVFDLKFARAAA